MSVLGFVDGVAHRLRLAKSGAGRALCDRLERSYGVPEDQITRPHRADLDIPEVSELVKSGMVVAMLWDGDGLDPDEVAEAQAMVDLLWPSLSEGLRILSGDFDALQEYSERRANG